MEQRIDDLLRKSSRHREILSSLPEGKVLYEELANNTLPRPPLWALGINPESKRKQQAAKYYEEYAERLDASNIARRNPAGKMNARMGYRKPKFPQLKHLEGVGLEEAGPDMYKLHPGLGVNHFDDSIDASLERVIATISGIRTVEKEAAQTASHIASPVIKKASGSMMGLAAEASRAVAAGTKGSKALRFRSAAAKLFKSRL